MNPHDFPDDVGEDAVLSAEEAEAMLQKLYQVWGLTDEEEQTLAKNAILVHLVKNGSSSRGQFRGVWQIRGKVVNISELRKYRDRLRPFARCFADHTRDILSEDAEKFRKLRSAQAQKYGVDPKYGYLCFDFAEKCSELTMPEQAIVNKVKGTKLAASSYNPVLEAQMPVAETIAPAHANAREARDLGY
jgi:hypothetical protein